MVSCDTALIYLKILKMGHLKMIRVNVLKTDCFYSTVLCPKDRDVMANSVDPDQTASGEAV